MMDYGPELVGWFTVVDGVGRRFYFDDRYLPPATQPARRTAARNLVDAYARRMFAKQAVGGLPAGNLLDVAIDPAGWRNV